VSATRTGRCAYCGQPFTVARRPGPAPRYCSHAHRQRAYEIRRGTGRRSREATLTDEVNTLRAHVRRLEYDNRRLRDELDRTTTELNRLHHEVHPPSAAPDYLTAPTTPHDPPTPPPATRTRRWPRTPNT
jgi:hypothetical protein